MNLADLAARARENGPPVLLAEGRVVIAHGHPRNTFDLDLLAPRTAVESLRALALKGGHLQRRGPGLPSVQPAGRRHPPLDLLSVSADTFARLERTAVDAPIAVVGLRRVCLRHLLALKAHALQPGHPGRIEMNVDQVIRWSAPITFP